MTIGAAPMTRSSTAVVSQVVQPRLLAPVTTNDLTGLPLPLTEFLNGGPWRPRHS